MNSNMNEPDITRLQEEARNPEVTYEPADLSARAVVVFLIFLAVGGLVITLGMWGAYKYIAGDRFLPHPLGTRPATQAELQTIISRFPPPRLQPNPVADMNAFRVQEDLLLNTYGWIDQANGKIHIPIERAMDMVAASGLPVRSSAGEVKPSAADERR
jgi:hypothetical protein